MITEVRDIKKPSISFCEEINRTKEVGEADKKSENISLDDTSSKPQREGVKDKLEVFEILKLLLNDSFQFPDLEVK